ncbi:MAG: hypothetical protein BMS9Abin34_040 [Patescibacteria group bacterium]|nr:MAG: hypothetical protein BMS9Abin34_040 [Patescibacteria group bacterium]
MDKSLEENVLLEWESLERVFTKRGKTYFRNLFSLLAFFGAVAVFFKEFLLVGALGAFGFAKWAMGTTPPKTTKHVITDLGIRTHGHEYGWDQLKDFWFSKIDGQAVLQVDTKNIYPGRIYLVLGKIGRREITEVLKNHLPYRRKVKRDLLEKISVGVSRRFPLE